MAKVTIKKVHKTFDKLEVVHGIDLDIAHNEFLVLVGPSGCGKSTTLRMVAGLEDITQGEIYIGERLVNDVPPKDRDIAMVFQNYALYPHMTVFENMSFGLKLRKYSKVDISQRVREAAGILNIEDLLDRRPKQLSGGQRQRVAMGRAIVRHPQVFLFDEPLSNLDAKLRVQMRTEIKRIHRKVATTVIYVTHDQVEAMTLADRTVVMNEGNIEQVGTPQDLYENPATHFVAGFIGSPSMNFIPCKLGKNSGGLEVHLGGKLKLKVPKKVESKFKSHVGKDLLLGIRPEHITDKRPHKAGSGMENLDVKVEVLEPMGVDTMVFFSIADNEVCARVEPHAARDVGQKMTLTANMNHMHLIDPDSGNVVGHTASKSSKAK